MITLYFENGVAYVWNCEDWFILRSKHRICGALIGSAPSFPRQNEFAGLPMALMSEETALLLEKGICEMYELPNLATKPSDSEKQDVITLEKEVLADQIEALRKRKIDQLSQKIDIILAGKRQKLLSKGINDITLDKQSLLQEEISKLQDVPPAHTLVHLPSEHYLITDKKVVGVEDISPCITDGDGATRYAIFKDLWEKGHYITDGSKFGSDYLVYPGDPVRFHATYMVRCVGNQKIPFLPKQLVTFGRLSVAVNKLAVLACCSSDSKIHYQTLQWHDNING